MRLLSHSLASQWGGADVVRAAEMQGASTTQAIDHLAASVDDLEQRLEQAAALKGGEGVTAGVHDDNRRATDSRMGGGAA